MALKRLFIYPKDLVIISGYKIGYCYKLYKKLLDAHGKTKKQGLTIKEYCDYVGLKIEHIEPFIH